MAVDGTSLFSGDDEGVVKVGCMHVVAPLDFQLYREPHTTALCVVWADLGYAHQQASVYFHGQ